MSVSRSLLIRRLSLTLLVLATLLFAAPAFSAHACEPNTDGAAVEQVQGCGDCEDCAQACTGGCCHASHSALPDIPGVEAVTPRFATPAAWTNAAAPPLARPTGPERPPRA